jgi:hypothetical protein
MPNKITTGYIIPNLQLKKKKEKKKFQIRVLPPLNGERLVIPVLLGPYDIDVRVNTGFRHGSQAIQTRDLNQVGRIDLIVAVYGAVGSDLVGRVRKGGGAQDRGVRNRRTQNDEGAH